MAINQCAVLLHVSLQTISSCSLHNVLAKAGPWQFWQSAFHQLVPAAAVSHCGLLKHFQSPDFGV